MAAYRSEKQPRNLKSYLRRKWPPRQIKEMVKDHPSLFFLCKVYDVFVNSRPFIAKSMTYLGKLLNRRLLQKDEIERGSLFAFYDLSVSPTSFNFATFLSLAELHRRKIGCEVLHVVFVPAPGNGFWDREPYDLTQKQSRLRNLLVPLCRLMPSCQQVTVCSARAQARRMELRSTQHVFPEGYSTAAPEREEPQWTWANLVAAHVCGDSIPALWTPPHAQADVRKWIADHAGDRRVVSITLREASYYPEHNSNLGAWGAFARLLDQDRYFPVIVRDTEAVSSGLPEALNGLTVFPRASTDVEIRAALHEESYLNLSVATGPMILLWLNPNTRFLIFKFLCSAVDRGTPKVVRSFGIEPGSQMITATRFQRLVWDEDKIEVIRDEFEKMAALIDGGASATNGDESARPNAEPPLRTARRLRENWRIYPARQIYKHMLREDPDNAIIYYALSNLELHTVRIDRARKHFDHARSLQPEPSWETVDEALEVATCHHRWREIDTARAIYQEILRLESHSPDALHGLGVIARETGQPEKAVACIRDAIELDPYTGQYHYDLGESLRTMGQFNDAAEHYRRAVTLDPSHDIAPRKLDEVVEQLGHKGMS